MDKSVLETITTTTEYLVFFNVKYNKKMQGLTYALIINGVPYMSKN